MNPVALKHLEDGNGYENEAGRVEPHSGRSPDELQSHLNVPVIDDRISNSPKLRCSKRSIRNAELRRIQYVEELRSELQRMLAFRVDRKVLEDREIEIHLSWSGTRISAQIAESKPIGQAECGSIEEMVK